MHTYDEILPYPERRRLLEPRCAPYRYRLYRGRFLIYRRPLEGPPSWAAFGHVGRNRHLTKMLGRPNDQPKPQFEGELSFEEARIAAHAWLEHPARHKLLCDPNPYLPNGSLSVSPIGDAFSVARALHEYISWKKSTGASARHLKNEISVANVYLIPLLGNELATELTAEAIQKMMVTVYTVAKSDFCKTAPTTIDLDALSSRAKENRKKRSNYALGVLKRALNRAWNVGEIQDNRPWAVVETFRTSQKPTVCSVTTEEIERLLATCPDHLKNIVLFCALTGCRTSEAVACRFNWVDLTRGVIRFPSEGRRNEHIHVLSRQAWEFLQSLTKGKYTAEPLFKRASGRQWTLDSLYNAISAARLTAKLHKQVCLKSLRQSYIGRLLASGVPATRVAAQVGLQNLTVVSRYGHVVDDLVDRDIREHFPFSFPQFLSDDEQEAGTHEASGSDFSA